MTNKQMVSRRDFLKLGGLAAVSLPTVQKVGNIRDQNLLRSEDAYGGFLIRQLADIEPPYEVDKQRIKRFDATDVIFSRLVWDEDYIAKVEAVELAFSKTDPGYSHVDVALDGAATFCAMFDNTNSPLMGFHNGILALYPPVLTNPTVTYAGRWDHSHLEPEGVAEVVKKAAHFLGASLVGIAPLKQEWIYSQAYDILNGGTAPIEFSPVEEVELPEGQVSIQEAGETIKNKMLTLSDDEIKKVVVDVLTSAEPGVLPADTPPISIAKLLPASQFRANVGKFTEMPKAVLDVFAEALELDLVIADLDPGESVRPRYKEDGTLLIPETMTNVIVLAFEMDYDSIKAAPTMQGDIATQDGYSRMAITAGALALFIRGLGYNAIPCGNNTGISVPQAIDAGLGEGGRNGILITPKYGPRVRLAKVITDLPMAHDKPIKFGVEEFCKVCKKCAVQCPTQAIPYGEKTMEPSTMSSNSGVLKWSVNAEKCYFGWTANGSGCGNCIRVCPFNKPEGWLHDATRILIGAKAGSLDSLLVKLDDASGFGNEPKVHFWER